MKYINNKKVLSLGLSMSLASGGFASCLNLPINASAGSDTTVGSSRAPGAPVLPPPPPPPPSGAPVLPPPPPPPPSGAPGSSKDDLFAQIRKGVKLKKTTGSKFSQNEELRKRAKFEIEHEITEEVEKMVQQSVQKIIDAEIEKRTKEGSLTVGARFTIKDDAWKKAPEMRIEYKDILSKNMEEKIATRFEELKTKQKTEKEKAEVDRKEAIAATETRKIELSKKGKSAESLREDSKTKAGIAPRTGAPTVTASGFGAGRITASSEDTNNMMELLKKLVEIWASTSEKIKTPVEHPKKSSSSNSGPSYSSNSGSYNFVTVDTASNKPSSLQKNSNKDLPSQDNKSHDFKTFVITKDVVDSSTNSKQGKLNVIVETPFSNSKEFVSVGPVTDDVAQDVSKNITKNVEETNTQELVVNSASQITEKDIEKFVTAGLEVNATDSEIKIAVTDSILNRSSLLIPKDDLTKLGDEAEVVFFDANGKELSRVLISTKQNAKITNLHNGLLISIRPSQEIKLNQLNNNLKLNSTND